MNRRRLGMIVGAVVMVGLALALRGLPGSHTSDPVGDAGVDAGLDAADAAPRNDRSTRTSTRARGAAPLDRRLSLLSAPSASESPAEFGRFSGRVVDQRSQAGVPSARLSFRLGDQVLSVGAGPDGEFAFEPTQAGTHELVLVEANGYFPFAPTWGHSPIRLAATPHRSVDDIVLRLEPEHAIRVSVADEDGQPVEGELLVLGLPAASLAPLESTVPLVAGSADLVAPTGTVVEAVSGGRSGRARVDEAAIATGALSITVSAAPSDEVRMQGRVADDATGAPIPNALIEIRDDSDRDFAFARVLTNDEGWFEVALRGAGPFSVWASAEGYAGEGRDDVGPGDPIELLLVSDGVVSGTVVDEEGAPIRAFAVLAAAHLGRVERSLRGSSAVIDSEGRFRLGGLASGRYDITVYADRYKSEAREVEVGRDAERELAPIVLAPAAVLRGLVESAGADSTPVADAHVQIERAFSPEPVWTSEHRTDSSGHFEIRALDDRTTTLLISAPLFHSRLVVASTEALTHVLLNPTDGEPTQLELTGIGAELRGEGDVVRVVRTFAEGGATRAGLVGGESIVAVDGTPVTELGFVGTVERIRGPENSVVRLNLRSETGEQDIYVRRVAIRAQ